MASLGNMETSFTIGRRQRIFDSTSDTSPQKRQRSDPFVHHGRHFGRTVHAQQDIRVLIKHCLPYREVLEKNSELSLSAEELQEYHLFTTLLEMVPGLEESIKDRSWEEVAGLIQKGISSARSEDTKSLKEAVFDWITPPDGSFSPALDRKQKAGRGFDHPITGALLCPAGMNWADLTVQEKLRSGEVTVTGDLWPVFLYPDNAFDEEDPWKGLLRSPLLVKAYKHIFFGPSTVSFPVPARSGQAAIHEMSRVTPASIAYIASQLSFALSNKTVCAWTNDRAEHVQFYLSLQKMFNDEEEKDEVEALLAWWDKQLFPTTSQVAKEFSLVDRNAARALQDVSSALPTHPAAGGVVEDN